MEKRVILAVVLCAGIFMVWQQLFPPPKPAVTPPPITSASARPSAFHGATAPPPAAPGAPAARGPLARRRRRRVEPSRARGRAPHAGGPLRPVERGRDAQARPAARGQVPPRQGDPTSGYDVVRPDGPATGVAAHHVPGLEPSRPPTEAGRSSVRRPTPWSSAPRPPPSASRSATAPTARATGCTSTSPSRTRRRSRSRTTWRMHVLRTPGSERQGRRLPRRFVGQHRLDPVPRQRQDRAQRRSRSWPRSPWRRSAASRWIGADEKFFLLAALPYPEVPPRERKCIERSVGPEIAEGVLTFSERELPAGGRTTLLVRDLRRPEGHQRPGPGSAGRRRRQARRGGRRHAGDPVAADPRRC